MTDEQKTKKLNALIADLQAVGHKHNMVLDEYATENGPTAYYFKLQFEDVQVNIREVFMPVYHGPPR
jgi:hypothetical protein